MIRVPVNDKLNVEHIKKVGNIHHFQCWQEHAYASLVHIQVLDGVASDCGCTCADQQRRTDLLATVGQDASLLIPDSYCQHVRACADYLLAHDQLSRQGLPAIFVEPPPNLVVIHRHLLALGPLNGAEAEYPSWVTETKDGVVLVLEPGKPCTANAGCVWVSGKGSPDNRALFAKIDRDGNLWPQCDYRLGVRDALLALAADLSAPATPTPPVCEELEEIANEAARLYELARRRDCHGAFYRGDFPEWDRQTRRDCYARALYALSPEQLLSIFVARPELLTPVVVDAMRGALRNEVAELSCERIEAQEAVRREAQHDEQDAILDKENK